jgi:hypothetical protein
MTSPKTNQLNDPDIHKGAIESDRPSQETNVENKRKGGVDTEGMPDNPVAQAQDRIGANDDESQG